MSPGDIRPLEDAISRTLAPLVQSVLDTTPEGIQVESVREEDLYMWYASEVRFICVTHQVSTIHFAWCFPE